jgi:hypothetical protein
VKRSIESFENDRDESRLQQLVIGKLFHWIRIRQAVRNAEFRIRFGSESKQAKVDRKGTNEEISCLRAFLEG